MNEINKIDPLPTNSIPPLVTSGKLLLCSDLFLLTLNVIKYFAGQTTPTPSLSNSNSSFHTDNPFSVALSYSGKTEGRVKRIKKQIHNISKVDAPLSVFFAPDFQDELAQIDGMRILEKIYREAQLVVVFLSNAYPESDFCYGEWRIISDRFFGGQKAEQQKKCLLLVKFTNGNFKYLGLVKNDFYIDGTTKSNKEISKIIVRRFEKVSKLPVQ